MTDPLAMLVASAVFFLALHLVVSGTTLRARIVGAIGEGAYLGLFSLFSLAGIVALAMTYNAALPQAGAPLWHLGPAAAWAALALTGLGFLLAVPGLLTPNPTSVGQQSTLERSDIATGILAVTRHPFLWGVLLWATAHLLVNGDLPSLILFGSFVLLTLFGTRAIDAKRARALGPRWAPFAQATSNVPFLALLSGRAKLSLRQLPWLKMLAGLAAFVAMLHFHQSIFGVSPFPPMG